MAWKVERWLADIFPGEENIYSEYRDLPPRELAIVTAAVLDSALAEILARRLKDNDKEIECFLGLNGDGRAPVATFGARIQLGLLLGVLTQRDMEILRTIKKIRNEFAHRANVGFLSPSVLKETMKLISLWIELSEHLAEANNWSGNSKHLRVIEEHLPRDAASGEGLLLGIFCVYQAYFHRIHSNVIRIGRAVRESNTVDSGDD